MAGSIKLINASNPPKQGTAVVRVTADGTKYTINPKPADNPVALSGVLNSRFTQVNYYST